MDWASDGISILMTQVHQDLADSIAALQGNDDDAKLQALEELWNFSYGDYGVDQFAIREAGGIPPLVALLESDSNTEIKYALELLQMIAKGDPASKIAIRQAGGIPMLIELLSPAFASVTKHAAKMLQTLSLNVAENKLAIREAGGIPPLLELVKSGSSRSKRVMAALALQALASDYDDNAVAIALARGRVEAFVKLARRGRMIVRYMIVVDNAGPAAKRKAALVVAQLLRDVPVPRDMKDIIVSYL